MQHRPERLTLPPAAQRDRHVERELTRVSYGENARFIPPRKSTDADRVLNSGDSRADFGTRTSAAVSGQAEAGTNSTRPARPVHDGRVIPVPAMRSGHPEAATACHAATAHPTATTAEAATGVRHDQ